MHIGTWERGIDGLSRMSEGYMVVWEKEGVCHTADLQLICGVQGNFSGRLMPYITKYYSSNGKTCETMSLTSFLTHTAIYAQEP